MSQGCWLRHGSDCCSSVTKSCLILCDPRDCSTLGFPVIHCLPDLAQTHVHWVSDAIQPSLSSPYMFAYNLSQIKVVCNELSLHIRWPKYWSFSISSSNEHSRLISFRIDWFDLFEVQGTLKSLLQHTIWKHQFSDAQPSLWPNSHIHTWLMEKS